MDDDVAPVFHEYVYGGLPPEGLAVKTTVAPEQMAGLAGVIGAVRPGVVYIRMVSALVPAQEVEPLTR